MTLRLTMKVQRRPRHSTVQSQVYDLRRHQSHRALLLLHHLCQAWRHQFLLREPVRWQTHRSRVLQPPSQRTHTSGRCRKLLSSLSQRSRHRQSHRLLLSHHLLATCHQPTPSPSWHSKRQQNQSHLLRQDPSHERGKRTMNGQQQDPTKTTVRMKMLQRGAQPNNWHHYSLVLWHRLDHFLQWTVSHRHLFKIEQRQRHLRRQPHPHLQCPVHSTRALSMRHLPLHHHRLCRVVALLHHHRCLHREHQVDRHHLHPCQVWVLLAHHLHHHHQDQLRPQRVRGVLVLC